MGEIRCTSPEATIPVNLSHVMHFGLNTTIRVSMTCENPNPYSILMKSTADGSKGKMLVPNLTDFSRPPIVAGDVVFQEMELEAGSRTTGIISESAVLSPAFIQESLGYILAHNKTFPAYMEMDVKTDAQAQFMFISKQKQDVLPRKYCGYYLGLNAAMTTISITSPMICRNSYEEMQTAVESVASASGPLGFVDNLDPSVETLDSLEHEINLGAGSVMTVGYCLCVMLWVAAGRLASRARLDHLGSKASKDVSRETTDAGEIQVQV